jgi:hypothetical protein
MDRSPTINKEIIVIASNVLLNIDSTLLMFLTITKTAAITNAAKKINLTGCGIKNELESNRTFLNKLNI